uniref:Venom protein n=1 Tax=Hadrurus spadix TaxID=141984 RepID=A0A1W7R963_9SCOR
MYALQVIVLSVLFCYVLSNEKEEETPKYCAKHCAREQVRNCGQDHFPLLMSTYRKCVAKLRDDLSTVEEWDQFMCEDATKEEFTFVSDCFYDTMNAKYGNIDDKLEECFEKSGC